MSGHIHNPEDALYTPGGRERSGLHPDYVMYIDAAGIYHAKSCRAGLADFAGAGAIIQTALTAMGTGFMFFKRGTFVHPPLTVYDNQLVAGSGKRITILQLQPGSAQPSSISVQNKHFVDIRDLSIDTNRVNQSNQPVEGVRGIDTGNSDHLIIQNVEVYEAGGVGIYIGGGDTNVTVSHCYVHDCCDDFVDAAGIQVGESNLVVKYVNVVHCETTGNTQGGGIRVWSSGVGRVYQCIIADNICLLDSGGGGINSEIRVEGAHHFIDVHDNLLSPDTNAVRSLDIRTTGGIVWAHHNYVGAAWKLAVTDTSSTVRLWDNVGYNPLGNILTPWSAGAGTLSDSAAAQNNPSTATLYTMSQSPKLILLTNCAGITEVQIDGVTLAGITTADPQIYKLFPGQTIKVTWATTTPNGQVFAE